MTSRRPLTRRQRMHWAESFAAGWLRIMAVTFSLGVATGSAAIRTVAVAGMGTIAVVYAARYAGLASRSPVATAPAAAAATLCTLVCVLAAHGLGASLHTRRPPPPKPTYEGGRGPWWFRRMLKPPDLRRQVLPTAF